MKHSRTIFLIFFVTILSVIVLIFSFNKSGYAAEYQWFSGLQAHHQQTSTLFLVVDRLESSSPTLRSAWLLVQVPSSAKLSFLPIYPSLAGTDANQHNMALSFQLNKDGTPSSEFVHILKILDIRWDEYLILDELALAGFVELLDGVWLSGELVDSQSVQLGTYFSRTEPNDGLFPQAELLSELCRGIPLMAIHPDLEKAISNLIMHSYSSMSLTEVKQAINLATRSEFTFSCEFPTIHSNNHTANSLTR